MATAIILAGGLGTRLRSVLADTPKPMAPINDTPFLQLQLDYWIEQGIRDFVLSVGYRHEAITGYFGEAYRGASIAYAVEEAPLGTGGGLLLALERVPGEEPLLLLNGDTYFDVAARDLFAFHTVKDADLTFCLFRADEAGRYGGVQIDATGRITKLTAAKAEVGDLANGGVYALHPAAFRDLRSRFPSKSSFEDNLMPALLQGGARFFGLECKGRFIDIGVPADYRKAAELVGRAPKC